MSHEFATTIEVNGDELDVVVEYTFSPGTPDVMYLSNGDPGYPGDPGECEVLAVYRTDDKKREKDLMPALPKDIIEYLFERACDEGPDALNDAYEAAMEDKAEAAAEREWDR